VTIRDSIRRSFLRCTREELEALCSALDERMEGPRSAARASAIADYPSLAKNAEWVEALATRFPTKWVCVTKSIQRVDVTGSLGDVLEVLEPSQMLSLDGYFDGGAKKVRLELGRWSGVKVYFTSDEVDWIEDMKEFVESRLRRLSPWWSFLQSRPYTIVAIGILALLFAIAWIPNGPWPYMASVGLPLSLAWSVTSVMPRTKIGPQRSTLKALRSIGIWLAAIILGALLTRAIDFLLQL